MPASPASIPNDCFSWHIACLVDIDSPSANERNVETIHRLIQRPATRIESLWRCLHPGSTVSSCEPPGCTSLACHKKNLEGSAHVTWFGGCMADCHKNSSLPMIDRLARGPQRSPGQLDHRQTSLVELQHHFNKPVQRVP